MTGASTRIAAVRPFVQASKTNGLWNVGCDRDLVRPGAAFADLDARLFVAGSLPGLPDRSRNILLELWLRTIEVARSRDAFCMAPGEDPLEEGILHVRATRPAMMWGKAIVVLCHMLDYIAFAAARASLGVIAWAVVMAVVAARAFTWAAR